MEAHPQEPKLPSSSQPIIGTPPASMPQVPQGPPSARTGGTARDPKDAFQDPNASHYIVELWAGIGSQRFNFACASDLSAAMGAFLLALKYQPKIHTFGVWKKQGPQDDAPLQSTVCFVAMHQMIESCSKSLDALTGKQVQVQAVPVETVGSGFEELSKQLKDQRRRGP